VQDEVMIKVDDEAIGMNYFISDMMGRILIHGILPQSLVTLNLGSLASGQYLFVIRDKTLTPIKLIKQ
jgi:hypothetical protein